MFSYYGARTRNAKHYPRPQYKTIVEPFCGAARYSLLYPDKKVILNDLYPVVYELWDYLISVSPEEINSLPDIRLGDDIRELDLTRPQQLLLGFCVGNGRNTPGNIVTTYGDKTCQPAPLYRPHTTWECTRTTILKHLDKIRHWQVSNIDYRDLDDIEATWFIDPPFQHGGQHYVHSEIDYCHLAHWCKTRKGQVIVCEADGANWLPFKPLRESRGVRRQRVDMVWTNLMGI